MVDLLLKSKPENKTTKNANENQAEAHQYTALANASCVPLSCFTVLMCASSVQ